MKGCKVCVYAICKNESEFVDRWMDSMSEADLIVVTDTGSDDDTVQKLRGRGAVVHAARVSPWRFDAARNISLGHVPEDVDICVCTDLDEYFSPGWREALEKAWNGHRPGGERRLGGEHRPGGEDGVAKTGRYLYNWSLKADGSPDVQFYYFKVHGRHGFRWKCPVHEYVLYEGALPLEVVFIDGMVLNHAPDPKKSRGSYLPLLELAVREDPRGERMRYYLGREYLYKGDWQRCIDTLEEYLALPNARWNEERCAAMRWIAAACWRLGRVKQAYGWFFRAVAEAPGMRDGYVEFSKMCFALKDWPMTLLMAEEALKIREKSRTYVNMGYAWDHTPDDLCAVAASHMNLADRALVHAERALRFSPEDERLKRNFKIIAGMVGPGSAEEPPGKGEKSEPEAFESRSNPSGGDAPSSCEGREPPA